MQALAERRVEVAVEVGGDAVVHQQPPQGLLVRRQLCAGPGEQPPRLRVGVGDDLQGEVPVSYDACAAPSGPAGGGVDGALNPKF